MNGALAARCTGVFCALSVLAFLASPAAAIEFWEERVAIHGFYAQQIRSLVRDFSFEDDFDLAQWYHVLNLEIEVDVAPEGFGPFDLVSAFGRIEVRYDCVWRRACGIFSGADAYGDRARKLPKRMHSGRRAGYVLEDFTGDTRRYRAYTDFSQVTANLRDIPTPSRDPIEFGYIPGLVGLSASKGPDGELGTEDDPWPYYTEYMDPDHCLFAVQRTKGPADSVGTRNLPMIPKCKIRPIAPMADKANPLRAGDFNPATEAFGSGALPLRPAPRLAAGPLWSRGERAQGVWLPNQRLAEYLREGEFDSFDQNFRQRELEWNRGASQQDEKELKELYFDLELFDSRLWFRIGKQNIVWGKTELFRTTDQFNPQDLALASLPNLEESRIALWAVRAVWSFYNVGPLEDVRLELAMNYDQFEPTDLGRCGEPYAPLPVCDKTYGLMAHGFVAGAIAGEMRPPNPWNSWKGTEVGARLEWRYDRFSFAITDFYGYNDGPYADPIFSYSRNVDPRTGRPRVGMSTTQCKTGGEPACLTPSNALTQHSVNQTQFHFICATSIGFLALDTTACGQSIFNSQELTVQPDEPGWVGVEPRVMIAVSNILSGQPATGPTILAGLGDFTATTLTQIARHTAISGAGSVLVPLVLDPNDGEMLAQAPGGGAFSALEQIPPELLAEQPNSILFWVFGGIQRWLTDEQEALLGCGPFYGTLCDLHGIDLMNLEASASIQSWAVFDGTFGPGIWDTTDASRAQPGTVGFLGGPVCTRYESGRTFILPGCRGPRDPGYDRMVDGSTGGALQPFTGQEFRSEMAILSWNLQMLLVTLSAAEDPNHPRESEFDPDRPFRKDGCSLAAPAFCGNIAAYNSIIGARRDSVRAGGNGRYGRRDFIWHGGGDIALRYEKRNVLGFSLDFAEDITKSNWGLELTWIEGVPFTNNNAFGAASKASTINLTISVDRPTFINFLNQNRTFFFNSQWFFQYVDNYVKGFTSNGPWNTLATFTVTTGYFQDRLLPGVTFVYDFQSNSGAALPSVTYRFTENFSATFGMAGFWGRYEKKPTSLWSAALTNRVGRGAYKSFVENGLSAVRERDEFFMRIRYTF